MAHQDVGRSMLRLVRSCKRVDLADPLTQCLAPRSIRTFATATNLPVDRIGELRVGPQLGQFTPKVEKHIPAPTINHLYPLKNPPRVLTTLHSWPSLEPQRFTWYGSQYLDMPLRRDLLHRAVIFEGDAARRGTASTKHRSEVTGSNRKVLQQKGTGKARAGDKNSPIRVGGGVAHGPKPRDFSTGLHRKVYDKAWRTALSHRYRKSELKIVDGEILLPEDVGPRYLDNFFETWQWGKGHGRTFLVVDTLTQDLSGAMKELGHHGLVKDIEDVDVKDLLETGRVVIERKALDALLIAHSSDIAEEVSLARARRHIQGAMSEGLTAYQSEINVLQP